MKKKMLMIFILILTFGLLSCSEPNLVGTWKDPGGLSEITFEAEKVIFFDSIGTYHVEGHKIIMMLNDIEINFKFELVEDDLILYLEDSKIKLKRQ